MQPLHSLSITEILSLLRTTQPQCLASVFRLEALFSCAFFFNIQTPGSRSFLQELLPKSRHLYAGHHSPNNQVANEFVWK